MKAGIHLAIFAAVLAASVVSTSAMPLIGYLGVWLAIDGIKGLRASEHKPVEKPE